MLRNRAPSMVETKSKSWRLCAEMRMVMKSAWIGHLTNTVVHLVMRSLVIFEISRATIWGDLIR